MATAEGFSVKPEEARDWHAPRQERARAKETGGKGSTVEKIVDRVGVDNIRKAIEAKLPPAGLSIRDAGMGYLRTLEDTHLKPHGMEFTGFMKGYTDIVSRATDVVAGATDFIVDRMPTPLPKKFFTRLCAGLSQSGWMGAYDVYMGAIKGMKERNFPEPVLNYLVGVRSIKPEAAPAATPVK